MNFIIRFVFKMRVTFSLMRLIDSGDIRRSLIHFATVFIFYCQSAFERNSSKFTIQAFRERIPQQLYITVGRLNYLHSFFTHNLRTRNEKMYCSSTVDFILEIARNAQPCFRPRLFCLIDFAPFPNLSRKYSLQLEGVRWHPTTRMMEAIASEREN